MRRLLLVGGLTVALAWPAAVLSQNPDGSPAGDVPLPSVSESRNARDGWVVGFGMFVGNGLESGAGVSAGMGVQIGWMMTPTLALMLDTHGAAVGSSEVDGADVSSTVRVRAVAAAAVQWWPTKRFWLRGGIGPGRVEGVTASVGLTPSTELEETKNGFGATVATGYELYQGPLFALDVHARYADVRAGGTGYSTVLFGLGFKWYP